jgi:hypothetical protein
VGGGVVASLSSFPSPAQDYYDGPLDLNRVLIPRLVSTVMLGVVGVGVGRAGVWAGDFLLVDRALSPTRGGLVVIHNPGTGAEIAHGVDDLGHGDGHGGGLTVGLFTTVDGAAVLITDEAVIRLDAGVRCFGVVITVIRPLSGGFPLV